MNAFQYQLITGPFAGTKIDDQGVWIEELELSFDSLDQDPDLQETFDMWCDDNDKAKTADSFQEWLISWEAVEI